MLDTAEKIIDYFELEKHPEGGYFKEVYRSESQVESPVTAGKRSAVTDIYYLLEEGEVSRFHQVRHDEIWHFYTGYPISVLEYDGETVKQTILGDLRNPQFKCTVRGGIWQAAESLGEFSLVGCTVAPGFDFADFRFLADDQVKVKKLSLVAPEYTRFI